MDAAAKFPFAGTKVPKSKWAEDSESDEEPEAEVRTSYPL
jgi:hypothetical protein